MRPPIEPRWLMSDKCITEDYSAKCFTEENLKTYGEESVDSLHS